MLWTQDKRQKNKRELYFPVSDKKRMLKMAVQPRISRQFG